MTDRLQEVARSFREALDEDEATRKAVAAARAKRKEALEKVAKARTPLAAEIVAEARRGTRQRDIVARIEGAYTREQVRRICRAAGIEPGE
jgi:hypothetical protein